MKVSEKIKKAIAVVKRVLLIIFIISAIGYLCYRFPNHFLPVVVGIVVFLVCFYVFAIVSSQIGDWPFTRCKDPRAKLLAGLGGKIKDIIFNSDTLIIDDEWRSLFLRNEHNINGLPEKEDGEKYDRRKNEHGIPLDVFKRGYSKPFKRTGFSNFFDFLLSLVGLDDIKWVGLFQRVYKYPFEYNKIEKDEKTGEQKVVKYVAGKEYGGLTPYVFLGYVQFGLAIKGIESRNPAEKTGPAVQLNLLLNVLWRIRNPYKAIVIMKSGEWYSYGMQKIEAGMVPYIGNSTFEEIVLHQKGEASNKLINCLDNKEDRFFKEVVELADLSLVSVNFTDLNDAETLKKPWTAELKKKASIIEAEAKAASIEKVREAEVKYLKEVAAIPGAVDLEKARIDKEKMTTVSENAKDGNLIV